MYNKYTHMKWYFILFVMLGKVQVIKVHRLYVFRYGISWWIIPSSSQLFATVLSYLSLRLQSRYLWLITSSVHHYHVQNDPDQSTNLFKAVGCVDFYIKQWFWTIINKHHIILAQFRQLWRPTTRQIQSISHRMHQFWTRVILYY